MIALLKVATKQSGFSLVEILMSISLFSVAMIGLYFAFTSVASQTAQGLKGDMEAAYSKILIGQVDIYDIDVETAYDVTTKTALTLPDGTTAYYTRDVRSEATTPDVKEVSVYFYKNSTDTDPYRNFTKEFAPKRWGYNFKDPSSSPANAISYRDRTGQAWTMMFQDQDYDFSTAGSYVAGLDSTTMGGNALVYGQDSSKNGGNVNGSIDTSASSSWNSRVWRYGFASPSFPGSLIFKLPASQGVTYKVHLGFNEESNAANVAGYRVMDIAINGTTVDSDIDIFEEVGQFTALTKIYTATPVNNLNTNNVYAITINLTSTASRARLSWIMLERMN